jgi:hypothetical protein
MSSADPQTSEKEAVEGAATAAIAQLYAVLLDGVIAGDGDASLERFNKGLALIRLSRKIALRAIENADT